MFIIDGFILLELWKRLVRIGRDMERKGEAEKKKFKKDSEMIKT